MASVTKFHNVLPEDAVNWRYLEHQTEEVLSLFNYQEMRLSVLQDYNQLSKGMKIAVANAESEQVKQPLIYVQTGNPTETTINLRPEGTINVLMQLAPDLVKHQIKRIYYQGPMFRLDAQNQPLEFNQLGVELLGSDSILSENEVISLSLRICQQLGLTDTWLDLSSFGCSSCQPAYFQAVQAFLEEHKDEFCQTCYSSLQTNPFQTIDCKNAACRKLSARRPLINDYLCPSCKANFERVRKIQTNLGNHYQVNHRLGKSFAYYNETVFNLMLSVDGKNVMLGGGGRYDYLSSRLIGKQIPAVGFYLNLDLIYNLMKKRDLFPAPQDHFRVYVCTQSEQMEIMLLQIIQDLHEKKISTLVSSDLSDTDKETANALHNNCQAMVIVRADNIREGKVLLKNLVKNNQKYLSLSELVPAVELIKKAVQQD